MIKEIDAKTVWFYVEDFCPVDHYRCLMPVEYKLIQESSISKIYKKERCICHNVRDEICNKTYDCSYLLIAPDTITI